MEVELDSFCQSGYFEQCDAAWRRCIQWHYAATSVAEMGFDHLRRSTWLAKQEQPQICQ
jgi:hypothetical protein